MMDCKHMVLVWLEKGRSEYDEELMICAGCSEPFRFRKVYAKGEEGRG